MASCITSKWGDSWSPQVKLTVNQSSSTGNTATLSWTLQYIAEYKAYTNGSGRSYSVVIDGATVKSGTYDINQKVGTYTIASGSKTVSKSTSSRNVSFSCSFNFNLTWAGSHSGTRSASGSIGISATESHTVSYNANGGSGAPSSQTKWYGTILTLSSTKPTRTGYSFQGWATSSSGSVAYAAGGQYGLDQNVTLYAVWKANTYTVSYNANGGSGAPGNQTKTYGVTLKLSTTKPTRTNYNFKGWGTSAGSTTVAYASGASYTANASITLYAVWELAYVAPRISNFQVMRANSSGTEMDDGTYLKVKFNWSTDRTVTAVKVQWYNTSGVWADYWTISASGTSGSVEQTTGGNWDTETSYQIRVYVSDSGGTTYSAAATLASMAYVIDFKSGGTGVAFGKVAEVDNVVESKWLINGTAGYSIIDDMNGSKANTIRSTTDPLTFRVFDVYNSEGMPTTYGNLFEMVGRYDHWQAQLLIDGTKLYIRNKSYNVNSFSEWYRFPRINNSTGLIADNIVMPNNSAVIQGRTTNGANINILHVGSGNQICIGYNSGVTTGVYTPLICYGSYNIMSTYRFTSGWIGRYVNTDSAVASNSANRKWWIGDNGTQNLYIVNQAGKSIELQSTESIVMKCSSGAGVEIYGSPCFIDFHHNNSSADYTHRLLTVSGGNINAYPGITNASDERLKKDIELLDNIYINVLKDLQTKTYRFKKNDKYLNIGLIAQDVLEIFKKYGIEDAPIVSQNELDGMYGIDYSQISALLVYGWQKQQEQLNEQQSVIDAQQKEIDDLKSQVQELKELVLAMSKKEE